MVLFHSQASCNKRVKADAIVLPFGRLRISRNAQLPSQRNMNHFIELPWIASLEKKGNRVYL